MADIETNHLFIFSSFQFPPQGNFSNSTPPALAVGDTFKAIAKSLAAPRATPTGKIFSRLAPTNPFYPKMSAKSSLTRMNTGRKAVLHENPSPT
ncbi:MAG: hypothetical protein IJP66_00395 [Kiritimatiellae bacterium]|nr:hypothetical protein [Kiritimatiellia bacterium]